MARKKSNKDEVESTQEKEFIKETIEENNTEVIEEASDQALDKEAPSDTPEEAAKAEESEETEKLPLTNIEEAASQETEESIESTSTEETENNQEENIAEKDKEAVTDKQNKKEKIKKPRPTLTESFNKLQDSIPALLVTFFSSLIIMGMLCIAIFFMNAKGAEKVLVPNVEGKNWDEALLEMQIKELYPKINLRYSDTVGDEGKVLEQSPKAGAIVKGYSRVSLVISRGAQVDEIGEYQGKNLDEVRMSLQSLFAGQTKPLITLAEPQYKPDPTEAGTILEQDPPAGTKISHPVTVNLVVSKGPNYEKTRRPYVIGQTINDLLQTIARSKIVFDITSHDATSEEKAGTVVNQEQIEDEYIPNYSRVSVEMAMPKTSSDETVSGIFQTKLPEYPYPVAMKIEAVPSEGNPYTILNLNHPGGNFTIPYTVNKGTTLILYVVDKVFARTLVE